MRSLRQQAFTLLEVMVAVAILALALTAIFSSEAGAIKVAQRARTTTVASMLARCKMAEVEEQVADEGLPAIDDQGSDECCEDAEQEGFECDWRIERVVLPEATDMGEEGEGDGLLGGGDDEESSGAGPDISKLQQLKESGEAGPGAVTDMLGGGNPQDALAQMAFQFAFPILKPAIEEQVRRATVTVKWKEGVGSDAREKSFDVVQYLVAPPPPVDDSAGGGGN